MSAVTTQPDWTRYHAYVVEYEGEVDSTVSHAADVPRLAQIAAPKLDDERKPLFGIGLGRTKHCLR
jgi:hypothetical protein